MMFRFLPFQLPWSSLPPLTMFPCLPFPLPWYSLIFPSTSHDLPLSSLPPPIIFPCLPSPSHDIPLSLLPPPVIFPCLPFPSHDLPLSSLPPPIIFPCLPFQLPWSSPSSTRRVNRSWATTPRRRLSSWDVCTHSSELILSLVKSYSLQSYHAYKHTPVNSPLLIHSSQHTAVNSLSQYNQVNSFQWTHSC